MVVFKIFPSICYVLRLLGEPLMWTTDWRLPTRLPGIPVSAYIEHEHFLETQLWRFQHKIYSVVLMLKSNLFLLKNSKMSLSLLFLKYCHSDFLSIAGSHVWFTLVVSLISGIFLLINKNSQSVSLSFNSLWTLQYVTGFDTFPIIGQKRATFKAEHNPKEFSYCSKIIGVW